jgi:hypothetical protein
MEGEDLARYLKGRHPPVERDQVISKGNEIQQQIEAKRKNRTFAISKISNSPQESIAILEQLSLIQPLC